MIIIDIVLISAKSNKMVKSFYNFLDSYLIEENSKQIIFTKDLENFRSNKQNKHRGIKK